MRRATWLLPLLAASCHLVLPHHPPGSARLDAAVEGGADRARGERARGELGREAAPPRPCARPEDWSCQVETGMPPRCTLSCQGRAISCTQIGLSTCGCTISSQACGSSVALMLSALTCAKGLSPCWTALDRAELACCRE